MVHYNEPSFIASYNLHQASRVNGFVFFECFLCEIIEDDPHSTVEAVAIEVGISTESAQTILTQSLGMNKISARWVPHRLAKKNIQDRLRIAKETLKEYESVDSRRLMEIVTGDETWFIIMNHFVRLNLGVGLEKISDGFRLPPLRKSRPDMFGKKIMYSIFFEWGHRSIICAKETLKEYESVDSRRLMEIVTGDETWFIIMNHFVRLNLGVGLEKIRMDSGCPH